MLRAGGLIAVGLRAGRSAVFVRADLPGEMVGLRTVLEQALGAEGLVALDRDSSLAGPLARECLGADTARWDLWGRDLADVFAVLAGRGATPTSAASPTAGKSGVNLTKPATSEASTKPATAPRTRKRRSPLILIVGLLLLAVLGGALFFNQRDGGETAPPDASGAPPADGTLVDYVDPDGLFSLKYPATWRQAQSPEPQVRLEVFSPANALLRVQLVPLPTDADPTDLASIKAVTDGYVRTELATVITESPIEPVEPGGLTGYYYFYRQTDPASGVVGVNSHFFLVQGPVIHSLVFQAVPPEEFSRWAEDFDVIVESYKPLT
ncbi:MAG: hypothetical protein KY440_12400 [Actinobacteria bacterium]|nr:hypothetical protein [Actinomycetota bacterium]